MKRRKKIRLVLINIFFIIFCFILLVPIIYAFSISINESNSILSSDLSLIPKSITLKNYHTVLFEKPFLLWLKNSIILSILTVILTLSVVIPAAYVFARHDFKGKKSLQEILLVLNSFPAVLSMFAMYRILKSMGLINTRLGLSLVYIGTMAIFAFWNLKGYFETIPVEIEEAARIDGVDDFGLIRKIIFPLASPSIIITSVLILIFVWNEYIFVTIFLMGAKNYTLAAGLYSLQATDYTRNWPLFSSASILTSIPILIMFFIIQKKMKSGLTVGGVKG